MTPTHTDHVLDPLAVPLLELLHLGDVRYDSDHIAGGVGGNPCQGLRVYGPARGVALVLHPHITLVRDAMYHAHLVEELERGGGSVLV